MTRNILKSNNTFIGAAFLSNKEAFHTGNENLNLFNLVQSFNFSASLPHEKIKQLGSPTYVVDEAFIQPDITLDISYLPNTDLNNERYNFFSLGSSNGLRPALSGTPNASTNFYVFNDPIQGEDGFADLSFSSNLNLSGYEVLAFGNAFLTNYSLNYAVGAMPLVATSYICSNTKFEDVTGSSMESVAINLESGNNNNVGNANFNFSNGSKSPAIVHPVGGGSSVTMENLQVGGQVLSGIHYLQSVNLNVSLPRVSSYGLGSDYAYNRKLQLPAQGSFTASSLVSGLEDGDITGVLDDESSYSFDVILQSGTQKVLYRVEGAKLDSYSYGMDVNGQMSFDSQFSFPVNESEGLFISGS
tara:strand:- start:456 stop:1529 length:1074 start_codon:yes stop_codon:yes gene_type:complete